MKRILFALLLLPQLAYSQYRTDLFSLSMKDGVSQIKMGDTFSLDTTLTLRERSEIVGLSISGLSVLENDNDSYIRVTLVDKYNYEYLVYENYPLLSDDLTTQFTNTAMETVSLDGIVPQKLVIRLKKASLRLESVNYTKVSARNYHLTRNPAEVQKEQAQYIVDRLNTSLKRRNMTWRAGMTSMSQLSFEEKKAMYGGKVPELYGFEHYIGGIFVIPGEPGNLHSRNMPNLRTDQYVSEWSWKDRHGKNWMTGVKHQGTCNSCWAFAALGALEVYINLYYNDLVNYDLSEEEIISCSSFGCSGGGVNNAFTYVRDSSVVNENSFPYMGFEQNCNHCPNPEERVSIEDYDDFTYTVESNVDAVKRALFKNPLTIGVGRWNHSMVMAGYKTIAHGDVIYLGSHTENDSVVIDSTQHQSLIGRTAWLLKNSKGTTWGTGGYCYLVFDYGTSTWVSAALVSTPIGSITCLRKNDTNIIVSDADGDGYYFWGLHDNKPSWCPGWIPETKDGDDSNHTKGKLYLESPHIIGDLEPLNPDGNTTLQITGNTTYNTRQSRYSHIRINSNATLTVKNILNLFGRVTITIESGGQLVIDGGVVTNTNIAFSTGGKLKIKNGGKLVMRTNTDFEAPIGALVEIEDGIICRSNDF